MYYPEKMEILSEGVGGLFRQDHHKDIRNSMTPLLYCFML